GLRLGRAGLAELRLGPRGPADHEASRTQGEAASRSVRRPQRRLTPTRVRGGADRSPASPRRLSRDCRRGAELVRPRGTREKDERTLAQAEVRARVVYDLRP